MNNAAAKKANFPGLNRVTQVAYPPGSTWKPVTALAAMQEHLLSPYSSIQCTPDAEVRPRQAGLQELGSVRQPADDPARGARDLVRHVLLHRRQPVLRGRRGGAKPPPAVGPQVRLRRPDRARHRQRGAVVADDRADAGLAQEDVQERLGQGLEPGRLDPARDRAEGRHRDAAADGALLRDDRERRQARDAVRRLRRRAARHEPAAARDAEAVPARRRRATPASIPAALQAVRDGLWAATHSTNGTSSGVFGTYPISISGKTGTAEKVVNLPGYPVGHLEDQSWWCGYGPSDDAELVVCAVIENGGHGSSAAAPAALRVFEKYFNQKAPGTPGPGERRLIADARHRTASFRSPSLGVFDIGLIVRRLDYLLLLAVVTLVGYGLWAIGGITRFDVPGQPRLLRHAPGDRGRARRGRDGGRDPDPALGLPASLALPLRRHDRRHALRLRVRRGGARLEALDRPRPVPVPAVRVRKAVLRARDRRVPGRARTPRRRARHRS